MDFKDQILQLSEKIRKQVDSTLTEEATKNAFIMPMLVALGYDVFDPDEVVPELDCDINKKKGEKIDYAIMRDGETAILIECKHCKQNLDLHSTQLQSYFVASKARFGVLTNGIEYRFYTDLDKANIMDERPFMVINMLDLSDNDIEQLKKFHKSYFDENKILSTAQQMQIAIEVRKIVNYNFISPSPKFTRFFVKETNEGLYSAKQIDQYAPIVKKEIENYVDDVISDRLSRAKENTQQPEVQVAQIEEQSTTDGGVETTQDELDAYNIIRSILRKEVDVSRITYADFKSYFVVCLDGQSWKWICRLHFKKNKYLSFSNNTTGRTEPKYEIKSLDRIFDYSEELIESLKYYLK